MTNQEKQAVLERSMRELVLLAMRESKAVAARLGVDPRAVGFLVLLTVSDGTYQHGANQPVDVQLLWLEEIRECLLAGDSEQVNVPEPS